MKKIFALIVVAVLCMCLVTACSWSPESQNQKDDKAGQKTEQKAEQKAGQKADTAKNDQNQDKDKTENGTNEPTQDCPYTAEDPLVIEIDPGHGGSDGGAANQTSGTEIPEKDVNLDIALALRDELSKYDNVKVCMTREDDAEISITSRQNIASEDGADLIISIHNNAKGDGFPYTDGCMVLTASGNAKEELSDKTKSLGAHITRELEALGIANRGLLIRIAEENTGLKYENGNLADYYGIVRNALENDMMGIIVEHAYIDDAEDYEAFLSDQEKRAQLAQADARGIAAYFQLEPISGDETVSEPIIYMTDDEGKNTEYYKEDYPLHSLAE